MQPKQVAPLVVSLLLAACGGGSGNAMDPQPPVSNAPAPNPPAIQHSADVPAGYTLVWNDEFNATGLPDAAKWGYDTEANRTGWYNNEEQYYAVAKTEYSRQEDGRLLITAKKASLSSEPDWGGQIYTSARLITRGKASWTYGFIEVRAKMPCGQGTWPAIWMLGTADTWPDSGEIDIMEHVGMYPGTVSSTVHTRSTAGTSGNGAELNLPDACTAFHNYQATWTADRIVFAVDGKAFHTYVNPGTGAASWPFDQPQYMLLNLAIGGDMAGGGGSGGPSADVRGGLRAGLPKALRREALKAP